MSGLPDLSKFKESTSKDEIQNEKLFQRRFVPLYSCNILYLIASRQHVPSGPCWELKLERSNKERESWVLFAFSSGRGGLSDLQIE